jgi:hypothetical protein
MPCRVVFAEALRHTGSDWTHPAHSRSAILVAYNHISVRWHEEKEYTNPTVVGGLSLESIKGSFGMCGNSQPRRRIARARRLPALLGPCQASIRECKN